MTKANPQPTWFAAYLDELRGGATHREAAERAGVSQSGAAKARRLRRDLDAQATEAYREGAAHRPLHGQPLRWRNTTPPAPPAAVAAAEELSMEQWLKLTERERRAVVAGYEPAVVDERREREQRVREQRLRLMEAKLSMRGES